MGERGGVLLGDSLTTNGRLVRLDLSNCGLRDAGAKAVGHGLESSMSLRWLNLSANRLGIQTAQALCTTLEASLPLKCHLRSVLFDCLIMFVSIPCYYGQCLDLSAGGSENARAVIVGSGLSGPCCLT